MASTFTSDTLPADHKAAIRQMKHALRAQLGDVQQIFNQLSDDIATRVAEINALKAQGDAVWPVLSYADIKAGHVTAEQREQIKRRGCAVIKAISPRTSARLGSVDAGLSGPQTALTRSTKAPAIISSGTLSRPVRFTPSTGRRRKCRPARVKKWRMRSRFSIVCGHLKVMESNGLTRM